MLLNLQGMQRSGLEPFIFSFFRGIRVALWRFALKVHCDSTGLFAVCGHGSNGIVNGAIWEMHVETEGAIGV